MARAPKKRKTRRKTQEVEPGVPVIRTGKRGRPRRMQPGDRVFAAGDWSGIEADAGNGATCEELTLAYGIPADEEAQGRLRRIVEVGNARYKLQVREAAARLGVRRVGKETSVATLQAVARNELGWDQDAQRGPTEDAPNLEDLRQNVEAAIGRLAKRKRK